MFQVGNKRGRKSRNLGCESLEDRRLLAVVTSAADSGPGTLRDALAGPDPTITFDVAAMGTDTIILTSGNLLVDRDVAIDGDDGGGGRVTLDGGGLYRVLMTDYNGGNFADQSISNMVITNGYTYNDGGGIQSFENLTLDNVLVTGNYSLNDAGGIGFGDEGNFAGDLVISNSVISNNVTVDDGGGLDFYNGATLLIDNSTFQANTAGLATQANVAGAKVGGAMRIIDILGVPGGQTSLIQNSVITENAIEGTADGAVVFGTAAGIVVYDGYGTTGNPTQMEFTIQDSTMSYNYTQLSNPDLYDTFVPYAVAGALDANNYTINIDNVNFIGNTASIVQAEDASAPTAYGNYGGGYGGAVNLDGYNISVTNSTFDGNYAYTRASGISITNANFGGAPQVNTVRAVLDNVTVVNHGSGPGGGDANLGGGLDIINYGNIYNEVEVTVSNSTITGNTANFGGGIASRQGVQLTVNDSDISGNYANGSGGGLYVLGFGETAEVNVNNTTIADNSATFNGAGILLRDNTPYATTFNLNNSTVSGNIGIGDTSDPAYQDLGDGGGIFNNGILMNINQSTISYNQSPTDGGGIFIEYIPQDANISQSTIFGNLADADNGGAGNAVGMGGGIAMDAGNFYYLNVTNSVISGNTTGGAADEVYEFGYFQGNNSYVGAGAMLGPLQVQLGGTTATHEPMAGSPLIDAGDDLLAPFGTDQNGNARINDAAVDLGSVESGNVATASCDFNNDGVCDIDDLDPLTVEAGMGTNDLAFDLNNDGMVNRADVQQWLVDAGARPENAALTGGNPFLEGDANLDGAVDGADFIAWNSAKFTTAKEWSTGNFDANGATDGGDFIVWNMFKFQSSMSPAADNNGPIRTGGGSRIAFAAPAAVTEHAKDAVFAAAVPELKGHDVAQVSSTDRVGVRVPMTEAIDAVFRGFSS